jgi:hypothetical protein
MFIFSTPDKKKQALFSNSKKTGTKKVGERSG